MIESCLQDGVVSFQRYCEGMCEPFGNPSLNIFQRLDQGSEYWRNAVGSGYEDWLSIDEMNSLIILFQKRHLLSHSEGIVDARYIQKSKDRTYKEGQRIVVTGNDIDHLVSLVSKLSNNIRDACDKSY